MNEERGLRALLNGPDFQKLPTNARFAFLVMKETIHPSGIDVEYPEALIARLCRQTGLSRAAVNEALATLQERGWAQRQGNVLWLLGHLRYHPNMSGRNKNHRQAVYGHVSDLPRLPIVRRFVEEYPEYFRDAEQNILSELPEYDPEAEADLEQQFEQADLLPVEPPTPNSNGAPKEATPTQKLAYEVGRMCVDNDATWRLKATIPDWAHQIRSDPNYAGINHAYEVRKCNEYWQNQGKDLKAPDIAIRNWFENALKFNKRDLRTGRMRTTDKQEYDPGKSDSGWRA